ncbi:MAG TPA: hypothetical protein PLK37_15165 [Terricaulis sp.]|nr:hypothetical protein [Terricaulis sp.]
MQKPLFLAHAPADAARAAEIALTLAAFGYDVEASVKPGKAKLLVVLWSAAAARSPVLRQAARRAARAGGVVIVRLDGAKAPASLGGARALKLARGVGDAALWRRALEAPAPRPASAQRGSRLAGVGAALTMAACVAVALYLSDASFAARVDALAGVAQAQAGEWVDAIKSGG